MMKHSLLISKISRNCKNYFLAEPRLCTQNIFSEIISFAEDIVTQRNIIGTSQSKVDQLFARYYNEVEVNAERFWLRQRVIRKFIKFATKLGAALSKAYFTLFLNLFYLLY